MMVSFRGMGPLENARKLARQMGGRHNRYPRLMATTHSTCDVCGNMSNG